MPGPLDAAPVGADAPASPAAQPLVSVVVPVRNEAENIAPLVAEITAALAGLQFEIVYVDDGSTDGTASELRAAEALVPSGSALRRFRHRQSCGQSAAVSTGVRAARGRWIATLDGDGQNDPADIPRLLSRAQAEGGTVMIAGHRVTRRDTWIKRWSSRVANGVRARLLRDATPDTGCGLKVFPRALFLDLPRFDHMHRSCRRWRCGRERAGGERARQPPPAAPGPIELRHLRPSCGEPVGPGGGGLATAARVAPHARVGGMSAAALAALRRGSHIRRPGVRALGKLLSLAAGLTAGGLLLRAAGAVPGTDWVDLYVRDRGLLGEGLFLAAGAAASAAGMPRQGVAFLGGYAFGAVAGTGWALFAQVAGCALSFGWARLVGRSWAERRLAGRYGARLRPLRDTLVASPFGATLALRLLPVGNNLALNLLAGMAGVGLSPFLAASAVGYLPQTVVFALLGKGVRVDGLWQVGLAGVLLAGSVAIGFGLLRRHAAGRTLSGRDGAEG